MKEYSRTIHNSDMEKKLGKLKKLMETGKDKKALIRGDFNVRTARRGKRMDAEDEQEQDTEKKFKDEKVNKKGWKLLEATGKVKECEKR